MFSFAAISIAADTAGVKWEEAESKEVLNSYLIESLPDEDGNFTRIRACIYKRSECLLVLCGSMWHRHQLHLFVGCTLECEHCDDEGNVIDSWTSEAGEIELPIPDKELGCFDPRRLPSSKEIF